MVMRKYVMMRDQRVLVFQIPFTRNDACDRALELVVNAFQDESKMREIPAVGDYLAKRPAAERELFALLRRIVSGYTYWRAVGVFGVQPEASGVLQIIVCDTVGDGGLSPEM
jgi:hypothetical protein